MNAKPGHRSVVHIHAAWYILATSKELKRGKVKKDRLLGTPLVLFRNQQGRVGALLDRCPHRNIPLSMGKVQGDNLQCAYHGWQFDPDGHCKLVPALLGDSEDKRRNATRFACREQQGYIWVWGEADVEPSEPPRTLPDPAGYMTVRQTIEVEGSLHATIENALDVPHTAFLHKGLFRGQGEPNDIQVVVTRDATSVQAEFIGEPRPQGFAGKIISPSGGTVQHWDRFLLPSVLQVEYRMGAETHFLNTTVCTPIDDFVTRMYANLSLKVSFLPAWLLNLVVRPILTPVALRIVQQDAVILKLQTEAIERFDGERFVVTEVDVLGGQIWRLLRLTEQGRTASEDDDFRRELTMRV